MSDTSRESKLPLWARDELVATRRQLHQARSALARQNDGSLRSDAERALGALEGDDPMELTHVVRVAATGILAALLATQETQAELVAKTGDSRDLMTALDTITEAIKDIGFPDPVDFDGGVADELRSLCHALDFPLKRIG